VQQKDGLTSQVLSKTAKIPNTKGHVGLVKNISNVVVNSSQTPPIK